MARENLDDSLLSRDDELRASLKKLSQEEQKRKAASRNVFQIPSLHSLTSSVVARVVIYAPAP